LRVSSLSAKDSCYEIVKRTGAWLKYKVSKAQEFVIGGYTPDNPLDALIGGYYQGDKLILASKVRNGFVPRLRREVWARLKDLQTDACPFANLPEKKRTQWALNREEMKNGVWLKPTVSRAGRIYRVDAGWASAAFKFCGLREDKDPRAVVRE
jgi:bifunctional non-homologous end joining protein LigD